MAPRSRPLGRPWPSDDDGDICIMMKHVFVTKNHQFLLLHQDKVWDVFPDVDFLQEKKVADVKQMKNFFSNGNPRMMIQKQ